MIQNFNKINNVHGILELPGDKSISHRAVMFSAMANGKSRIINLSNSEDVKSTKECFEAMGVKFENVNDSLMIYGRGAGNFIAPIKPLFAGNSGTTARLICGILIAQKFNSILTGDNSLSDRPMKRVITPLAAMGGKIICSDNNTLPVSISPVEELIPIKYTLPVPSAQIKSSILIAGLHSEDVTSVIEKVQSRNHTEKMLGLKIEKTNKGIISYSSKENYPEPKEYFVPSDISTAAFFIVLTLLTKNSNLLLKNVSLNSTRTGYIEVLNEMGADIKIENKLELAGEEFGDIFVKSSNLNNVKIPYDIIPNIIDEIPILAVAGLFAEGKFEIRNATELRKKESDRIKAVCENLKLLGLNVDEFTDGFGVSGLPGNIKAEFKSYGDHRIAMAFGVLSMLLNSGGAVNGFECVGISNPEFTQQLRQVVV